MSFPQKVTITEVGPRDGLQNIPMLVPAEQKIAFINLLSESGLQHIEATSFVSPKAIIQLADGSEVFKKIKKLPNVRYSALVPNMHGMKKALQVDVNEIAIFTAASEGFNQRNIQCSIEQSISRFEPVMELAKEHHIRVRAYISCVLGCPYEGAIAPKQVINVLKKLLALGVDEISLGDTIGVGTAKQAQVLIQEVLPYLPIDKLIMHFHDTYGQAVTNIYAALELGVNQFDSAVAGLGGCPYAQGATGNVATEDVLYLMHGLGIQTDIDIYKVVEAGDMICQYLGVSNHSKVSKALLGRHHG